MATSHRCEYNEREFMRFARAFYQPLVDHRRCWYSREKLTDSEREKNARKEIEKTDGRSFVTSRRSAELLIYGTCIINDI